MLAYILIILRGSIPEILSLGLSNSLSVAGIFIGYIGLEKYTGVKTSKIPFYVLFGLMVLTTIFFTYIRPIPAARYFIISAVYMFMFSLCA
jgi:hypothetical protein